MKQILTLILIFQLTINYAQESKSYSITIDNAKSFKTFNKTDIGSMVDYYFASRIRGDQEWKKVLPDSSLWSSRMSGSIAKHNKWTFINYKNLGLHNSDYGASFKVDFCIQGQTDTECGEDSVEISKNGDEWIITKVPI